MQRFILGSLAVLFLVSPAHSYLPIECNEVNAETDFSQADVFAIGRVIGFERFRETQEYQLKGVKKSEVIFTFYARVKVGAVYKGDVPVGSDLLILDGQYYQPEEDNTTDEGINQCGTHARAGFQIGATYVVAVTKCKETEALRMPRYQLRSCHFSLHPIQTRLSETSSLRYSAVQINRDEKKPVYLAVDEFIEREKKKAREATPKR